MGTLRAIGEMAEAAGTTPVALRHYEEIGLLRPATRVRGQRRYHPDTLRRVQLIQDCQQAGFTLTEIRNLLDDGDHGEWHALAERKRDELREQILRLRRAMQMIDAALDCGCRSIEACGPDSHEGERSR